MRTRTVMRAALPAALAVCAALARAGGAHASPQSDGAAHDGAAQEGVADEAPAEESSEAAEPRPWRGSLGHGLAELRRRAEAGDVDGALEVAERALAPDLAGRARAWLEGRTGGLSERALGALDSGLRKPLAALGYDPLTPAERAEIHFARGVALRLGERDDEAKEAFEAARALGGDARPDAVYELGHVALVRAEALRLRVPEIAAKLGAPPPAAPSPPGTPQGVVPPVGGPAPAGAPATEEGDPLAEAKAAYEAALGPFTERLRLDWRDADTRANVELVRRRLAELEAIEEERREQEPPPESGEPDEDPKKDPKKDEQEKGEQDEPSSKDEPSEPSDDAPPEPSEEPSEGEDESEEEGQEPPAPDESAEAPEESKEEPAQPASEEELSLTREELARLLRRLQEHREQGEQVQEALKARNRGRAARDW